MAEPTIHPTDDVDLSDTALNDTAEHVAEIVVPEIWFPNKRVIRTVLQVIVSVIVTVAGGLAVFNAVAPEILDKIKDLLPPSAYAWLVGALAFIAALAGALSKIMAIPAVNALLVKFGAGSVPQSTIKS